VFDDTKNRRFAAIAAYVLREAAELSEYRYTRDPLAGSGGALPATSRR
jgi:hypothetical protein